MGASKASDLGHGHVPHARRPGQAPGRPPRQRVPVGPQLPVPSRASRTCASMQGDPGEPPRLPPGSYVRNAVLRQHARLLQLEFIWS